MLCNCYHDLFPELFHHPKQNLCTHPTITSHSLPAPSPWEPLIYILSLWICTFHMFHRSGIIQYVSFFVGLLSLSTLSSGLIHAVACVSASLLFSGWILLHCMSAPHFANLFKVSLSLLPILQPRNIFLKGLWTISLKCKYQGKRCPYLPVTWEFSHLVSGCNHQLIT